LRVVLAEIAPGQQRRMHHREIMRCDLVHVDRSERLWQPRWNREIVCPPAVPKRNNVHQTGSFDSGKSFEALQQPLIEGGQRFTFLRLATYSAIYGREAEEDDALGIEASIERSKLDQAAGEKSGPRHKQDRKRHLASQ